MAVIAIHGVFDDGRQMRNGLDNHVFVGTTPQMRECTACLHVFVAEHTVEASFLSLFSVYLS